MSERSPEPAYPPLPADWEARDSERGWYEYLRHCREEHLAGKPVPAHFVGRSGLKPEARERADAKRQGTPGL